MPPPSEGILYQDKIRKFLHAMGFSNVPEWGNNRRVLTLGGQEIDAFGRLDDLYVVIDAKTAISLRGSGQRISPQLRIINGYRNQVIQDIRNIYQNRFGYRDCLFIFWTKNKRFTEAHRNLARSFGIALRDNYDLDHYKNANNILQNRDLVRNGFLKDLSIQLGRNVFTQGIDLEVPALRAKIGNKRLYTFLLDVGHLLKFSYVFRVETNNILASYQRLLKERKISRIREYLNRSGFFANNILVATDENLQLNNEDNSTAQQTILTGNITLPDKSAYLEILDGQHRLLAYSNQPSFISHNLCVTAIADLDQIERAKLFVLVNREQTKVPAYLLWDLYTLIEPNSIRGKISDFVKKLNDDGPLKDLITLPRKRSPKAFLSFTNLCGAFYSRTNLFRTYGHVISFSDVILSFFRVLQEDQTLSEDWTRCVQNRGRKGFICTNSSLSIQIYLLSKILRAREAEFPQTSELIGWREEITDRIVEPFTNFLQEHIDNENQLDPFGRLRVMASNEGTRREMAETIFSNSPYAPE